jgi:uncharacterized membrane protein
MIRKALGIAWLGGLLIMLAAAPAHAELTLCNRTSYLMDVAIGLEKGATVATRGWFRIEPGQCNQVLDGPLEAELIYVHSRTPPLYGNAPLPQNGQAELCIRPGDFAIADGRGCPASEQARFSAAKPSDSPKGPVVYLAEQADYDDAQARFAGVQRLLAIAGYDSYPIDGVEGEKSRAAIGQFIKDHHLPANALTSSDFFTTLLAAARNPEGVGFAWCNDTKYAVMASLGLVEMGAIVTRGWYRVAPSRCLRPDVHGNPYRLYSYAEAVDPEGRVVKHDGAPLSWGGTVRLCTRDGKFELADHKDCASRGLNSVGFATIDLNGKPSATVHFREP